MNRFVSLLALTICVTACGHKEEVPPVSQQAPVAAPAANAPAAPAQPAEGEKK